MTLECVPGQIIAGMGMASGELARRAGVSPDTLRHYERVGVLAKPARSAGNYRLYPEAALARVTLVRRALAFGFSLGELAIVLKERERGAPPCRKVRALAAEKLASTENRLVELTRLRDDLKALLENWDRRLEGTTGGAPAHLLESLSSFTTQDPKETYERPHPDSHRRPHPLAGHWSHESPARRTPARGRAKR